MLYEVITFGLHDLKLAVEAVKLLGIPAGLVVNRADLGNADVFRYAEEEEIPILLTIPFDRRIAEAYSRGKLVVEELPEWREPFVELYAAIEKIVNRSKVQPCANS